MYNTKIDEKNRPTQLYALSVHPNGTRLATGGMDKHIRIWYIPTLIQEAQCGNNSNIDSKNLKMLAVLSKHSGSVLSLKWSPKTGRYLASASDDCKIFIWRKKDENNDEALLNSQHAIQQNPEFSYSVLGGFNLEQYIVHTQLQGHHTSDINGLAWTMDEQYLASCSLDGKAIIYRFTSSSIHKIHQLDCNSGGLKGIAWDPLGKYLAIQSDNDPGLLIYRSNDWKQVQTTLTKQHSSMRDHRTTGATFFARPSWSPDGQYLAISNGTNNDIPVVQVLYEQKKQRKSLWEATISFVGHQYPIEIVSFNPTLFDIQSTDNRGKARMYCAVGSQDKSISLWRYDYTRPTVVIQDLFQHSVLDMDWLMQSNQLHGLIAASMDGTLVLCLFDVENELGMALSDEEKDAYLEQHHDMNEGITLGSLSQRLAEPDILPESALELPVEDDLLSRRCPAGNSISPELTLVHQPVVTNKNLMHKKRIQPTLLVPAPAVEITAKSIYQSKKEHHIHKKIKKPSLSSLSTFRSNTCHINWDNNSFLLKLENVNTKTKECVVSLIHTKASFQVWQTSLRSMFVIDTKPSLLGEWIVLGVAILSKNIDNEQGYQSGVLLIDIRTGITFSPPWILDSPVALLSDKTEWIGTITQNGTMYIWDVRNGKLYTKTLIPDCMKNILDECKLDSLSSTKGNCHWPVLYTPSLKQSWIFHMDLQVWIPWKESADSDHTPIEDIPLSERLRKRLSICHDKQKRQDNIEYLEHELFGRVIQMESNIATEQDVHDLTHVLSRLLSSLQREPNSEMRVDYWMNQLTNIGAQYGTKGQLVWLSVESRRRIFECIRDAGLIK